MTAALADPLTELGGLAFLDDGFAWSRLLALATAVRQVHGEQLGVATPAAGTGIEAWLTPAHAMALHPDAPPILAVDLTDGQQRQVTDTLAGLEAAVPAWAPLLRLPARYMLMAPPTGALSASSRHWPQHVLLSEEAFTDPVQLRSQVLHELCHQWLYLIQEGWALQRNDAREITLPSGTKQRSVAEVLGAAHVAAALIRMYRTVGGADDRITHLAAYGAGCIALLADRHDDLTDAGRDLAARLKEAL